MAKESWNVFNISRHRHPISGLCIKGVTACESIELWHVTDAKIEDGKLMVYGKPDVSVDDLLSDEPYKEPEYGWYTFDLKVEPGEHMSIEFLVVGEEE